MNYASQHTKTIEMYISPAQFAEYTQQGFVVFMTRPTENGKFKAIKIEVVNE